MNIQTVSLSQLVPSKGNPRKAFDASGIEGLAASIKTDGLLQNLVVTPASGKGKRYSIVGGERRYRALKLLEERGELAEDFGVTVEIRKGLSKDESLRISTVENLQRQNLAPLEEAAALTKLVHKGTTLEDVAAQTGLSTTTIRRRLALNGLCKEAKKALREGIITLSQAEALTLGSDEVQNAVLDQIRRGYDGWTAEGIKEEFLDNRPTVALAIFPREQYTGTITTDLFAEEESSYFDDAEQFFELQRKAVEQLADKHRESAAWVEITDSHNIPDWQYRKSRKGSKGGVLINLSPSGEVEVREGLAKSKIAKDTAEQTADNPLAPEKSKVSYATPLRRYIAYHKTMAVQELLLSSPRKAKEVGLVAALAGFRPHEAGRALAKEAQPQAAYRVLEAQALLYAGKLGLAIEDGESVWSQFPPRPVDDVALYEAIKQLSDHELDGLQMLLAALDFGQINCERLDSGESLFNAVAQDMNADMRNHWQPDAAFFNRRTTEQLLEIAGECGCAEGYGIGMLRSFKKSELVGSLLRHFDHSRLADDPSPAQQRARNWLPEVMQFPAIDPDASEDGENGELADE